jgi:hypothetical protein
MICANSTEGIKLFAQIMFYIIYKIINMINDKTCGGSSEAERFASNEEVEISKFFRRSNYIGVV